MIKRRKENYTIWTEKVKGVVDIKRPTRGQDQHDIEPSTPRKRLRRGHANDGNL